MTDLTPGRPWRVTTVRTEFRPDPAGGVRRVTVVGFELTSRPYRGEVTLPETDPSPERVAGAIDAEAARVLSIYDL